MLNLCPPVLTFKRAVVANPQSQDTRMLVGEKPAQQIPA